MARTERDSKMWNKISSFFSFNGKKMALGPNSFATLDEAKAPNVKQYLRGLRNYYILSSQLKVSKSSK